MKDETISSWYRAQKARQLQRLRRTLDNTDEMELDVTAMERNDPTY